MTAYLLFVGLGILIYAGVTHTNAAVSGFVVLTAVILLSYAYRLLRNGVVAVVLFTGGVTIFIATMQALVDPRKCSGQGGADLAPSASKSRIAVPIESQAVAAWSGPRFLLVIERLRTAPALRSIFQARPKAGLADQSSMIPRFSAIVTACVRSFAPSFERTLFMWAFTVSSEMAR